MNWYNVLDIIARLIVLVFSLSLHEFAHAFIAYKSGDPTAKFAGRMTLNPVAHFQPMGFLMLLFLPVGFAKAVPVNPSNFRHQKRGIFGVAIAGVVTNIALAFIFTGGLYALLAFAPEFLLDGGGFGYFIFSLFQYFCVINISLFVFNLLPIYPLDGFRVVESFTRYNNKFCVFMRKYGSYILMGLLFESIAVSWLANMLDVPMLLNLDILGNLLTQLSTLILTPFNMLFSWFFGLFV